MTVRIHIIDVKENQDKKGENRMIIDEQKL